MSVLDRLDNISTLNISPTFFVDRFCENHFEAVENNFNLFINWYNQERDLNADISVRDFIMYLRIKSFCTEFDLPINEHTNPSLIREFVSYVDRYNSRWCWGKEEIKWAFYFLNRGLWEYDQCSAFSPLNEFFRLLKATNMKCEKGDFLRQYATVKKAYQANQEKYNNLALEKNQLQHKDALSFSYGGLTVVIPTTAEAFRREGQAQSNCVARLYLPRVIENQTNVVFIRKDTDLDKSFITCEVHNGHIIQYFLSHNRDANEDYLLEFRRAYQEWLNENW